MSEKQVRTNRARHNNGGAHPATQPAGYPLRSLRIEPAAAGGSEPEDFFASNTQLREEIVEGLIREGQLCTLGGSFNVGKTPLLAQMTVCILNGIQFCGRNVQRRPVIVFDFETAGPVYKRDLINLAERFQVPTPIVPAELEVYLEHGAATESGTRRLLSLMASTEPGDALRFLEEVIAKKPDALIIIDPLELLFKIDTNKKPVVLALYANLRNILARHPHAAILLSFNLRKKFRGPKGKPPDLLSDPRDWLEEICGTLDIVNRSDVRLGMAFHQEDDDLRVVNGVRRGEEMYPILLSRVGEPPDGLAGFDAVRPNHPAIRGVFTPRQAEHWAHLPSEFAFEEVADTIVPRASLSRLIGKAMSVGILKKNDGRYERIVADIVSRLKFPVLDVGNTS